LYSAVPYETSSRSAQAWSVLNGITQSYLPPTRFIPATAKPHLVKQLVGVTSHCELNIPHSQVGLFYVRISTATAVSLTVGHWF